MNPPVLQVAFLTGQSDPPGCALSPIERAFLWRIAGGRGVAIVDRNFPYGPGTWPWRDLPLWRASANVARQYVAAHRRGFAARFRPMVESQFARARETLLLAGSCGIELLRCLELPAAVLGRLSFVAYGTVAVERLSAPGIVVLGRRDWIARGRGPAPDHWVSCGHLDYLVNDDFAALCGGFLGRRLAAISPEHAAAL